MPRYVRNEASQLERERDAAREAVSQLRTLLSVCRVFVQGKALVPDESILIAIDMVMKETKQHERH